MDYAQLFVAFLVLLGAAFMTAASSVAVKCFNDNPTYKEQKESNYIYTAVSVAIGVLIIIFSFYLMYKASGRE